VSFIDEKSRSARIAFLKKKSDLTDEFKKFRNLFEKENDCQINRVHSDRGGEYNGLKKYLDDEGILLEMSACYCPESNGIAERYNRTINEKVRSMLSTACLPDELWAEAANYANYIRERVRPERQMAYV
jgi:transposase InsO family protein